MRIISAILGTALLAGCASQQGDRVWHKDGAAAGELETTLYECERDTRMSAASFSGGLQGAGEAQAFMMRCMNARGFYPVSASTIGTARTITYAGGVRYGAGERVTCQMRNVSPPLPPASMLAGECVDGGGLILGRDS